MRLRMLLVPVVAAAALVAAGCSGAPTPGTTATPTPTTNGVEAMEPDAIMEAATEALTSAESVHVSGTVGEGAESFTLDLTYAGANVKGTVKIDGTTAEVIKVGANVYVKADPGLFAQYLPPDQQALLPLLGGKWAKVNESLAIAFLPVVPLSVERFTPNTPPLTKGEVSEVAGTQAITVTDSDDQSFSVAIVGEPYLLETSFEGDTITFSDYDKSVTIEAPPAADVVDVLQLLGLG